MLTRGSRRGEGAPWSSASTAGGRSAGRPQPPASVARPAPSGGDGQSAPAGHQVPVVEHRAEVQGEAEYQRAAAEKRNAAAEPVGQENVGYGSALRAQFLGERRKRTDLVAAGEDAGLGWISEGHRWGGPECYAGQRRLIAHYLHIIATPTARTNGRFVPQVKTYGTPAAAHVESGMRYQPAGRARFQSLAPHEDGTSPVARSGWVL